MLNLKIYITKATEVSFEIQNTICYKISKWCKYRLDFENSNSARNDRIAFHFCSYLKLVPPNFLHFTKIKPLKSYEKCFLFHLNCSFGSCKNPHFRRKLEVKDGIIIIWNRLHILPVNYPEQFSCWHTSMDAQILAPKKWNIFLFTLLFCMFLPFKPK